MFIVWHQCGLFQIVLWCFFLWFREVLGGVRWFLVLWGDTTPQQRHHPEPCTAVLSGSSCSGCAGCSCCSGCFSLFEVHCWLSGDVSSCSLPRVGLRSKKLVCCVRHVVFHYIGSLWCFKVSGFLGCLKISILFMKYKLFRMFLGRLCYLTLFSICLI